MPAIRRVHDAAFGGRSEGRIVDDLRDGPDWLPNGSLVALDTDGQVVGHLLLSRAVLVSESGQEMLIAVIGPVGVLPERQGQGIGVALTNAAIDRARESGVPLVCLLGHAAYYPRFGFEPARPLGVEAPRDWPDASWLALRLPGWSAQLRGVVRYPAAFRIG